MNQTLELDTTLGALVRKYPQLITFFDQHKLDFCCGGDVSVRDLCHDRRWDLHTFMGELEKQIQSNQVQPVPVWEPDQAPELIKFVLDRFHAGHRRDFEMLRPMLERVVQAHSNTWPAVTTLANLVNELMADIEPHMQKEEQILFPMILTILGVDVQTRPTCIAGPVGPIQVMRMEHSNVGALLDNLIEITDHFTPPTWACNTLTALFNLLQRLNQEIRLHIHLENNVLFPMVLEMDW